MLKLRKLSFVLLFAAALAPTAHAAPPHDHFANAKPITFLPYSDTVDTTTATTEFNEPQACGAIAKTVWYSYVSDGSPLTLTLAADTLGSNFDTVLAVYVRPSTALVPISVTCNDDIVGLQSRVAFATVPGVTYYIQAGGFFGDSGTLQFHAFAGYPL